MATPLQRLIADNDPRNGTVAERLIRMIEEAARQPNPDGLYEPPPETTEMKGEQGQ